MSRFGYTADISLNGAPRRRRRRRRTLDRSASNWLTRESHRGDASQYSSEYTAH